MREVYLASSPHLEQQLISLATTKGLPVSSYVREVVSLEMLRFYRSQVKPQEQCGSSRKKRLKNSKVRVLLPPSVMAWVEERARVRGGSSSEVVLDCVRRHLRYEVAPKELVHE
jgi:hypothetical protein